MPEIKSIAIKVGGKFNLGNFENQELSVVLEADLSLTETVKDAYETVSQLAHRALALEMRPIIEENMSVRAMSKMSADELRTYVKNRTGFHHLYRISPEAANELVEETVAKYAQPEVEYVPPVVEVVSFGVGDEPTVEAAGDWEDDDDLDEEDEFDGDDDEILPDEDDEGPSDAFPRDDDDEREWPEDDVASLDVYGNET